MVKKFVEDSLETEEKAITEGYKCWKKAVPFLYDFVMPHTLHWPSLTFSWISQDNSEQGNNMSRMLVSASTNESKSHLLLCDVYLPTKENLETGVGNRFGTFKSVSGSSSRVSVQSRVVVSGRSVDYVRYVGGGLQLAVTGITTNVNSADVSLYEMPPCDVRPADEDMVEWDGQKSAQALCSLMGCDVTKVPVSVGWGGRLMGPARSGRAVAMWQLADNCGHAVQPSIVRTPSTSVNANVLDVAWWPGHEGNAIAVVGDSEGLCHVLDVRDRRPTAQLSFQVGKRDTQTPTGLPDHMSVAPNPFSHTLLATSFCGGRAALFDIRNTSLRIHTLALPHPSFGVKHEIQHLKWSPHISSMLACDTLGEVNASSSNIEATAVSGTGIVSQPPSVGSSVIVWDVARLLDKQHMSLSTPYNPHELLFVHGGHTGRIGEFDWHPTRPGVIGSSADDNVIHFWKPLSSLVPIVPTTKVDLKLENIKDEETCADPKKEEL